MSVDTPRPDVDSDDDATMSLDSAATGADAPRPTLPESIGRYRIVRKLGEGGMGIVYEAEQADPRRPVALKVVRGGGYVDEHHVRLFRREALSLARLKHPCIAAIYEAGRTDEGQYFFAMELVRGVPLHTYAKAKQLPMRQRLELFRRICEAINYAHQRGVIHRDLKPSNILIDADGTPKILDFGLAKITDSDVAVTTVETEIGKIQGTLPYMSPEQARGHPDQIELRSDVYSLGVILYELMTEQLPYDVHRAMLHEAVRVICEEPPRRPSTISRMLRGDIETIALKALEKEPPRRYQSAGALAEDIDRYLTDQPILARPPSAAYQFRKLVMRHKVGFGAVAAVFVALLGGFIVSTSLYFRSEANRIRAEYEAGKAQATLETLQNALKQADRVGGGRGPDVTLRSTLDALATNIEAGELAGKPDVEASIRSTIAETYVSMSLYDAAEPHVVRALAIRRRILGDEHPDTLSSAYQRARLLGYLGRFQEAEPLIREVFDTQQRVLGREHPDTLDSMRRLAYILRERGKPAEAEDLERQVLPLYRRVFGEEDRDTLVTMTNLGVTLFRQGRLREAEELFREALQIGRRVFGEEDTVTINPMDGLGWVLLRRGELEEAGSLCQRALELDLAVFGEKSKYTFEAMGCVALVLRDQGKLTEAEELLRRLFDLRREVLGPENYQTLWSLEWLAGVLVKQAKLDEARLYVAELIEHRRRAAEQPDASTNDLNEYAMLLLTCEPEDLRDPQAALPVAQRAMEMSGGEPAILDTLALAYFMTGDTARAIETQEKAIALLPPEESPLRTELEANLAKYRAALPEQESAESTDHEQPTPTDTDDENSKTPDDPPGSGS